MAERVSRQRASTMANIATPVVSSLSKLIAVSKTLLAMLSIATITGLASLVAHQVATTNHLHACDHAHRPSSCRAILSEAAPFRILPWTKTQLLHGLLEQSLPQIERAMKAADSIRRRINDPNHQTGLSDCMQLMNLSLDRLEDSLLLLGEDLTQQSHADVHTWLSAVLTNYVTCADGLGGHAKLWMKDDLDRMMALAKTSLALVSAISPPNEGDLIGRLAGEFPWWVSARDRNLLEASPNQIGADVVVAKDGSGKYKSVQAEVNAAPENSKVRYVIYVKKGTYKEKVDIGKKKKNIMLVGDGMDSNIITGSLNVVDGSTTFNSATVAAVGEGFMAQDICFENTAGPEKQQAVALRVGADKSVINRCRIDAYQDTLYPHSQRQFYRDSHISGTIDFIFGNAAVVFQNCSLIARKPMKDQKNMVTAQGRTDPNQNTGTSIQNCYVIPSAALAPVNGSYPTYLGRPWKEYSRTVYMQSFIDSHINPAGWYPWNGSFALATLYYGEYANYGPGAGTSKRVNWPGYHVITDPSVAMNFTVGELIQGEEWLEGTGVDFTLGLL
ncbi:hypothetical protein ACLOJK_039551 [Asimina triloba]